MNMGGLTHLEGVIGFVAAPLAGDDANAVDERDYFCGILLLELDLRVEQLESLHTRFAAVVENQVS